jgi:heme exporter protein B
MKTPFFKSTLAVLLKDLRAEIRSRELISAMALFALLSVFVFSFALELETTILRSAATGILWVTIVFAIILGLNRNLAAEREQGNMDAMLLAPIDRSSIFVGKMTANFLFGLLVGLLLLPFMSILYNLNLFDLRLIGLVVLGTLGLSSIGTLLAAMTVQTRARDTLLPLLMLPTSLPVLLLVVRASNGIINGQPEELWIGMPPLLFVLDVIYVVMSYLLFPYVLED